MDQEATRQALEYLPPSENPDSPGHLVLRCDGGVSIDSQVANTENGACHLAIQNLGGINSTELSISPGITALVGRNATNRSSTLRSLAAALGGQRSAATLKTDTDEGAVQLTVGEETYTCEYSRQGQTIQKQGSPFTSDADLVDTFVALFGDCPARRAVENDENLREILMKPVDTAEIQKRISDLKRERNDLDDTIKQAETRKKELPSLEEERTRLKDELTTVEEEIADLESIVENIDWSEGESSETAELRSELKTLRNELSSTDQRADEIKQQIDFRQEERTDLLDERDTLKSDLEEFGNSGELETKISELKSELTKLSNQRETLTQAVEDLQSVIQANETFLEGDIETVGFADNDTVTSDLDPDSKTVECWTCGTDVAQEKISNRIKTLHDIVARHRTEINEIDDQISELEREKGTYEEKLNEYEETTRRLEELENRIEQHAEKIQQLEAEYEQKQSEIDQLQEEIAAVETEIEQIESQDTQEATEFVDAHKKLTKLERERGRLENKLEAKIEAIEEIESLDETRLEAEQRRSTITNELEDLRGRIDGLETELVNTLNSIMEDLIKRLEYKNIARVWLERQTGEGETQSSFELHIVRETEDETAYEDTVDTLSESEREVVGLVVSLAGYLVHDVDREIPFLILDSVEMIDGRRLANLLEYIKTETDVEFLSVALLPKDAESVEEASVIDEYTRIDFETD